MYTGLQHIHSTLPYLIFIALAGALILSLMKRNNSGPFDSLTRRFSLFTLIFTHIQILLGIVLYFVSPITKGAMADFGAAMGESAIRFYAVEHVLTMILAAVAITIGNSKAKKAGTGKKAYNSILLYFTIALILILLRIPWHVWPGL
jgi:hypothetical protein